MPLVAVARVCDAVAQIVSDRRLVHRLAHRSGDAIFVAVQRYQAALEVQIAAEPHCRPLDARVEGAHAPGRIEVEIAVIDWARGPSDFDRGACAGIALDA